MANYPRQVMESELHVTMHPRDLLRRVALSMSTRHNNLSVTIPFRTTWRAAILATEAALGNIDEPLIAMPPGPGSRRALREIAPPTPRVYPPQECSHGLPIRSEIDLHVFQALGYPSLSETARQQMREMARKAAQEEFRQPYMSLQVGLVDESIPTVRGILALQGLHSEPGDPKYIVETSMIFDTGAHRTLISEELLSEGFRQYLKEPVHDPYRSPSGLVVQAETSIALSNRGVIIHGVASVVPTSQMPNKRIGILFGQASCIEQLNLRMIPRRVLQAKGEDVTDEFWGDIVVDEYLTMDGILITLERPNRNHRIDTLDRRLKELDLHSRRPIDTTHLSDVSMGHAFQKI